MAVITITSEMATGGRELGKLLARRLDYRYVDKSLFQDIAKDMNVSKGTLISFEETRRYEGYEKSVVDDEEYKKSLRNLLLETARKDNVVIVGRVAYFFLKNMKNCYHIRLVAPMDWREKYALENYKINPDRVQKFIEKGDKTRKWFRRSICGMSFDDSSWFHFTLNMSRTPIEKAVELIMFISNPFG
jgi:cytidylate kinase